MKKLLLSVSLIGILGGLASLASAHNTSCKDVEFSNGVTACVNIEDAGTDRRTLSATLDNGGSTSNLRCDIMTPDSQLRSVSSCNGDFWYDVQKLGRVKVWIRYNETAPTDWEGKPSTNSEWTYPQWVYNFDNAERGTDDLQNSSSSNYNTDNFYITASPSSPNQDEATDITIKARDGSSTDTSYRGTVRFKVERSSGNSRVTASSSLYDLSRTSYTFTSSDDGQHTFSNLVTFTDDSYDYRLVAYDNSDSNIEGTKTFNLNGGSSNSNSNNSNYNTDNFYVTASPSSPAQDEATDITVKARDVSSTDTSYRGTVRFKVERKSGSSRVSASSSLYDLSRTSYTFSSSDAGEHTFSNLVTFTDNSYDYRLVVYDNSDSSIEGIKTFSLNGGSSSNYNTDNFYITTDDSTPAQNQLVDLTIKSRNGTSYDTSYRGNIRFEVRYRASGNSNWTKTTSLSYYEMKYPYEDNGYTFNSSNNGNITITDFIRFRKTDYEYKVLVLDNDYNDIQGSKIFTIGSVDTSNNADNLYVTTDNSTPTTLQRVDLTVRSRNGTTTDPAYRGTVQFDVYKKASTSSTWTLTTSSSDYEMKSTYANGYTFTSSNAGQKTLTDLIRFKRNNYSYKVLVYDEADENIEGYKTFEVGTTSNSSSSSVNGFSSSQLNTVQNIYNSRDDMVNNLENNYSKLRSNSRRQTMSDDLKIAMKEIIDDKSNKRYDNFADFYAAFLDRYRYTISVR